MKDCNVHVYERSGVGLKRISAFDHPVSPETKPVVRVLYCGGVHYGTYSAQPLCLQCNAMYPSTLSAVSISVL
jgi:hypothetical protein